MIQIKTIKRRQNPWWKQLYSTVLISLEEYEKEVNEFCKTHDVITVNTVTDNHGRILHTIVYDDGVIIK